MRGQSILCPEHFAGEAMHDRLRRQVKVAEHFVRAPATQKLNDVWVYFSNEEGRGSRRSQRACGDLGREETQVGAEVPDGVA